MTSALGQTFANPMVPIARFPVTQPIEAIVAGLNRFRPTMLLGYPSALAILAAEARTGRLRISPKRLYATSGPALRSAPGAGGGIRGAGRERVGDLGGGTEAVGCWRGPGMHLCDDLVIIEPVGALSDKVYVTGILNPTLPLIRFEITDRMRLLDPPAPAARSIA